LIDLLRVRRETFADDLILSNEGIEIGTNESSAGGPDNFRVLEIAYVIVRDKK
jgi:hypothetical protein